MLKYTLTIIIYLFFPFVVAAATDQFVIQVIGGEDAIPPSTPTLLEVVPIASNQIDVIWSTATDDVLLEGYVLLRDGVPIATTTLTMFNDTGLSPETTYEYAVYAFDWLGNLSSTSNALATTTFALPTPPPPATTTPSTRPPSSRTVVLSNLDIAVTSLTATFEFLTDRPARYLLRWGRTSDFTGGYIENQVFQNQHKTIVSDLEPGTTYLYELVAFTPVGISEVLRRGSFSTLASVSPVLPVNISRLRVSVLGEDVRLVYELPETEIKSVRIVRNHLFYPGDIFDGAVVFDGNVDSFLDRGALSRRERQFYTVFVILSDGTVSSGAIGLAQRQGLITDTETGVPPGDELEILPKEFTFERENILIVQNGQRQTFGGELILDPNLATQVLIRRTDLPPHLKSIIVAVVDPTNQKQLYTYLLKLDREGQAYVANIPPLRLSGESRLRVEIYDFEAAVVARYQTPVSLVTFDSANQITFEDRLVDSLRIFWYSIISLAFMGLFLIIWRRRQSD